MDPLSDIIALLRPNAAVSKPISGRGRWGVRYQARNAPGFTIILSGEAWVLLDGREPLRLARGDFLLLPTTPTFVLCSDPDAPCIPAQPGHMPVRHGEQEGEADFVALGGSFTFERANAPLLLALLPDRIHIPASQGQFTRFGRMIGLLAEECAADAPGKELLVRRMLEILLVEAVRWRGGADMGAGRTREGGAVPAGLLNGMRDPGLSRALAAMHADVRARWTVAGLAEIAGMSRSSFSARFGEVIGCAPIEYLARWRMALARDALIHGEKPLDRIAEEIGYESASAFSTAFRKRTGMAPGGFARARELEWPMHANDGL